MGKSIYTDHIGQQLCSRIATTSLGLRAICKSLGISHTAVRNWIADPQHPFHPIYHLAKEQQADHLADEILEIADDTTHDYKLNSRGETIVNVEAISRSKLRIDARKWVLARLRTRQQAAAQPGDSIPQLPAPLPQIFIVNPHAPDTTH